MVDWLIVFHLLVYLVGYMRVSEWVSCELVCEREWVSGRLHIYESFTPISISKSVKQIRINQVPLIETCSKRKPNAYCCRADYEYEGVCETGGYEGDSRVAQDVTSLRHDVVTISSNAHVCKCSSDDEHIVHSDGWKRNKQLCSCHLRFHSVSVGHCAEFNLSWTI